MNNKMKEDLVMIDYELLRTQTRDNLLKACKELYYSELALCEPYPPKEWKDDNKKAWDEFIWRYQDYELVNEKEDEVNMEELNYDYDTVHIKRQISSGDKETN